MATKIPAFELNANNPSLKFKEAILFFEGKPFSGYIFEKYPNEEIASKTAYLQGKLENKQERWYANGSKMELRFYKDNRKTGTHIGWWENGQQKFEYQILNDIPIGTHREWYANGQLYSLATYNSDGQPDGTQKMWYETGQIKANYVIKNGKRYGFLGAKGCMGQNERKNYQSQLK